MSIGDVLLELGISTQRLNELVWGWNARNPGKGVSVCGRAKLKLSFELMLSFFEGPIRRIVEKLNNVIGENTSLQGLDWVVLLEGLLAVPC